MAWITALFTIGIALGSGLAYLVNVVYQHRSKVDQLRKQRIAMPKELSWFTGHLLVLQKYVSQLPPDANVSWAMTELTKEYPDTKVFPLDVCPIYSALLKYYGHVMQSYIRKELDQRFVELKEEKLSGAKPPSSRAKSVIALAIEAYLNENQSGNINATTKAGRIFCKTCKLPNPSIPLSGQRHNLLQHRLRLPSPL
ncbi:hypothetical protein K469DRAFT_750788 [Zopfia rhizophila CBS 207.26]|uniref:Uncharacterized protein n=1 Tax=Zopfia rhizophila CBS 207.26 TaxID=1314779 RepID=A0A6A6DYF8_9PEZI|nr:hypothetical protein K469DRAFT_750788 [Zopfia rhizophila CBS 207.26]